MTPSMTNLTSGLSRFCRYSLRYKGMGAAMSGASQLRKLTRELKERFIRCDFKLKMLYPLFQLSVLACEAGGFVRAGFRSAAKRFEPARTKPPATQATVIRDKEHFIYERKC